MANLPPPAILGESPYGLYIRFQHDDFSGLTQVFSEGNYQMIKAELQNNPALNVAFKVYQTVDLNDPESDIPKVFQELLKLIEIDPPANLFIPYLGAFQQAGQLSVVREYMPGVIFSNIIPNNTFSYDFMAKAAMKLCDGVRFLISRSFFNYSIKPDNLFLRGDGELCVCDFAMIELRSSIRRKNTSSRTKSPLSQPEIIRNGEYAEEKSDVFSIGMIIWMMAARKIPKVARFPLAEVKEPKLKDIVTKALNVDPYGRPDLTELTNMLADAFPNYASAQPPAEVLESARRA